MIILSSVGDSIRAEGSAVSSFTVTAYGIETAAGTETYKKLGQTQLSGGGIKDIIYTVPAGTSTVCAILVIANTTEMAKTVSLWHVPSGGSPEDNNVIFKSVRVEANSTVVWNKGDLQVFPDVTKTIVASGIQSNPQSGQYRIKGLRLSSSKEIIVTYDETPEP